MECRDVYFDRKQRSIPLSWAIKRASSGNAIESLISKQENHYNDLCATCTLGAAVPGIAWGGSFSVCGEVVFVQDAESSLTGRS